MVSTGSQKETTHLVKSTMLRQTKVCVERPEGAGGGRVSIGPLSVRKREASYKEAVSFRKWTHSS